jgi:hypothetical protein
MLGQATWIQKDLIEYLCEKVLSTYVGRANTTNLGLWNLSIIFTHGQMLGQATWIQKDLIEYLCEKVVINYQKGGIESPSLVLDNWWNLGLTFDLSVLIR